MAQQLTPIVIKIIPAQTFPNYEFSAFEIIVKGTFDDKTSSTHGFRFGSINTLNVPVAEGFELGVNAYQKPQRISPNDQREGSADRGAAIYETRYTIQKDDIQKSTLELTILGTFEDKDTTGVIVEKGVDVNVRSLDIKQPFEVKLTPSTGAPTEDQVLWDVINRHHVNFRHYRNFIDDVLTSFPSNKGRNSDPGNAEGAPGFNSSRGLASGFQYSNEEKRADSRRLPFNRTEAYSLLKYATEKYVEHVFSLKRFLEQDPNGEERADLDKYLGKDRILPYYDLIKSKIKEYFHHEPLDQNGFLTANADVNLIELIWNYWYEEGMVGQTIHAIARRFQNIKNGYRDPLLNFALDPLRPLNHILWGYIQDAQHRLSITRLNYEFASEYDLCVISALRPGFNPAERRSKFLLSFHRLIYEASEYFIQSDNTTIRPDGFKLLNALRDTHRILAEGLHNQAGDLPTVARIEMLIAQWILDRREVGEFLGGRIMVPYEESWMDRVDSMKALQGWDNTSISFYHDLAVYGEKIILGIRYGNWTVITRRDHATNWADAFRDAIQRYVHSYYTITGVDLAARNVNVNFEESSLVPGLLIRRRGLSPLVRRY